jgi:hypothetical protein
MSVWLYINHLDFWTPQDEDGMWTQLQFVYNEYTKDPESRDYWKHIIQKKSNPSDEFNDIHFHARNDWVDRKELVELQIKTR